VFATNLKKRNETAEGKIGDSLMSEREPSVSKLKKLRGELGPVQRGPVLGGLITRKEKKKLDNPEGGMGPRETKKKKKTPLGKTDKEEGKSREAGPGRDGVNSLGGIRRARIL